MRGTLSSGATEGDWLLLEGRWNVQFLRVTTLDSSVAPVWHEIEVFGG